MTSSRSFRFESLSEGKPGENIYTDHDVDVTFIIFLEMLHLYQIHLPMFVYPPCLSFTSGEPSIKRFVFSVDINRLESVFYVSESSVFEIAFVKTLSHTKALNHKMHFCVT